MGFRKEAQQPGEAHAIAVNDDQNQPIYTEQRAALSASRSGAQMKGLERPPDLCGQQKDAASRQPTLRTGATIC